MRDFDCDRSHSFAFAIILTSSSSVRSLCSFSSQSYLVLLYTRYRFFDTVRAQLENSHSTDAKLLMPKPNKQEVYFELKIVIFSALFLLKNWLRFSVRIKKKKRFTLILRHKKIFAQRICAQFVLSIFLYCCAQSKLVQLSIRSRQNTN